MNAVSSLAVVTKESPEHIGELWEAVRRLIALWANKYHQDNETRLYETDDLIQAGFLAVYDAVQGYNPDAGTEFTSYLRYQIQSRFAEVAGRKGTKKRPEVDAVSLDVPIGEDYDITKAEALPDATDMFEPIEHEILISQLHDMLEEKLNRIDPMYSDTLRRRYYYKETLDSIAADHGVSCETVRAHQRQGLNRLRGMYRDLKPFHDELVATYSYHGTGLTSWKNTGYSSVERTVERVY